MQAGPTSDLIGPLLALTDRPVAAPSVVVRAKDRPRAERLAIAEAQRPLTGCLIVASDPTIAADGVHLAAADPYPSRYEGLVGRSCHDAAELAEAVIEGVDYVTLSPVFLTESKPGYGPALGLDRFAELSRTVAPLPVYALGGIVPGTVSACRRAGAAGVAVEGYIAQARDPAVAVTSLIEEWNR